VGMSGMSSSSSSAAASRTQQATRWSWLLFARRSAGRHNGNPLNERADQLAGSGHPAWVEDVRGRGTEHFCGRAPYVIGLIR
jgi:hypothetical protein